MLKKSDFSVAALISLVVTCGSISLSAQVRPEVTDTLTIDETAQELANPVTALGRATLQFKRWSFVDNLPDRSRANDYSITFESSIPFPLRNGNTIRFRPTIPVHFRYPTVETSTHKTNFKSGLGDITFDIAYGKRNSAGILFAFGMAGTLPTATAEDLGGGRLTLGPEILLGIRPEWGLLGIFPNHEWRVAGKGAFSRTIIQPIVTLLLGVGWSMGSNPNISYDWINQKWAVPFVLNVGKSLKFPASSWSIASEVIYFGKQNNAIAPRWMTGINVTRVMRY
jgi:hypothetical protein